MYFMYDRLNTNVSASSQPEDRTHVLGFVSADSSLSPQMFSASVQLVMTAVEAAHYTLGVVYELTLTPRQG